MAEKFWIPPSHEEVKFQNMIVDENITHPLAWATKKYIPKKAFDCPSNYSNPLTFRYQILIDPYINELMKKEFPDEFAYVRFMRLNSILNEMGFCKNVTVIRVLGLILMKILVKTMSAGYVNEVRFLKLRASIGRNPVVLVPTHRSYGDFILMSGACFQYNVEIPVVVAGMDFYEMYGMATILRQSGAMFMRRSFKDDKVYAAVFKKYVETVIAKGKSPFEFFIEGMRSRSGKSLAPKLGLLKTIVGVYKSNRVEDITFVPITINYDRLLEDSLFAREVIGVPKPKESTTGLLKAMTLLEEFYGSYYMNVGNNISLKQFEQQLDTSDDFILHLAYAIIRGQQDEIIITISSFVCMAILCGLLSNSENLVNVSFLREVMLPLRKALTLLGAISTSSGSTEADIERTVKLHKFLKTNEEKSFIFISPYAHRGMENRNILENATTVIMIQHYANSCYHFLVNPAIIISILCSKKSINEHDLLDQYTLFRKLFKYEFLFFEPFESQDYKKALTALHELKLINRVNDELSACVTRSDDFWMLMLIPYVRSYLYIYRCLIQVSADQFIDGLRLKSRIKKLLELELDIIDDIGLYYAFSSNLLSCALRSLNDLGVVHFTSFSDQFQIVDSAELEIFVHFLSILDSRLHYGQMKNPLLGTSNCKL